MDYLIRPVTKPDLDPLIRLCQRHAEYEGAAYQPAGKRALLAGALFSARPALFCLVVESQQTVVGYASYTFDYSTWEAGYFMHMDCLYLEPPYRGYGIGRAIVEHLIALARERACVDLQWQTPSVNQSAIDFYQRLGGRSRDKKRFFLDL